MRKVWSLWLCVLFMCVIMWGNIKNSSATGPSHADIQIVPVTYRDGTILCKTRYSMNYTGDHAPKKTEYGWLIVSSTGRWEEHPHITFDPVQFQHDDQRMFEEYMRLEAEFDAPFNWASPPKSVQPLLQGETFQERDISPTYQKEDIVSAIQMMLTVCVECETRQRSLQNLIAQVTNQDTLEIEFYHEGVVLLHNIQIESQHIGTRFDVSNFMNLDGIIRDYGIEYQAIDGIFILSPPAEWVHAHTRAMYLFISPIHTLHGETWHVVCLDTPTPDYRTCVKETLHMLDIQRAFATEGDYIYLLFREEELLSFFRKLSIGRREEYTVPQERIISETLPSWLQVVNEDGRVLRHHDEHQHAGHEMPEVPSLREIEQIFLKQQGK